MATVVKNIFPSTLFNTASPQVALDQTAPMSFYVVLLNFFARFFFFRIINLLRLLKHLRTMII